jgi:hypothetical protein
MPTTFRPSQIGSEPISLDLMISAASWIVMPGAAHSTSRVMMSLMLMDGLLPLYLDEPDSRGPVTLPEA